MARSRPSTYLRAGAYIGSAHGDDLYVLDPSVLALAVFDRTGGMVGMRLLPEPFRDRLLERRLTQMKAWGPRAAAFVDTPATKKIAVGSDGRVLVLFSLPDHWGLLIDPEAWAARPLPLPEDRRLRDILWAASDASWYGDRLYVVSGSQLYTVTVEGEGRPPSTGTSGQPAPARDLFGLPVCGVRASGMGGRSAAEGNRDRRTTPPGGPPFPPGGAPARAPGCGSRRVRGAPGRRLAHARGPVHDRGSLERQRAVLALVPSAR